MADALCAKCSRPILSTDNKSAVQQVDACTMAVEHLTSRCVCRCTRLTNAFSKKFENRKASVAFYFMWYNFARIHQTLRVTPAMEAGVSDHVWSAEEIARLAD